MNRRELGLAVAFGWLSSTVSHQQKPAGTKEVDPVISVNRLDTLRFSIVVANCSTHDIKLGDMQSILGMDQFTFEIKTDNELIVLSHHLDYIHMDRRRPLLIPAGGHHVFVLDLGDGFWRHKSSQKTVDLDTLKGTWKAVRVLYKRLENDFHDHKTLLGHKAEYGLLIGELQSRWIDPQYPRRRFTEKWGEELRKQMDELKNKTKVSGALNENDTIKTESKSLE